MTYPLVSITIPTYNSALFLPMCLEALSRQDYKNFEVIIIDGGSSDATQEIALRYGATCIDVGRGLLRARVQGVQQARGEIIVLLDSDQVLLPNTLTQAVKRVQESLCDMLVLEEDVYKQETLLEKLFHYDRIVINHTADLDPLSGVMLPRLFKADILRKALDALPDSVLDTGDRDHAIIYYEASLLSDKVGILQDAVLHIEPEHVWSLMKKFYRWGQTNVPAHHPRYYELIKKKEVFRKGLFTKGIWVESFGSLLLLFLKGIPYKTGFYLAKLKRIVT